MRRIYLYGIVDGQREADLGIAGVDGVSPVRLVTNGALGCVVSDYRSRELRELPKDSLVKKDLGKELVENPQTN
jgi:hypothetical protein